MDKSSLIAEMAETDGYFYLASPYSHEERCVIQGRVNEAERAVAWLTKQGVAVFGAIHHSHPLVKYGFDSTWNMWQSIDKKFMDSCKGIIVLCLNGWRESVGVNAELEYCAKKKLPIFLMEKELEGESLLDYKLIRIFSGKV